MNIVIYICFLVIGLIMGLIGGGGSILGVPVLVYLNGMGSETATTYSLFIVGLTSLIGAFTYLRNGEISGEAILQFALASILAVLCTRKFLLPAIPDEFDIAFLHVKKDGMIMVLFAVLMLSSSYSMIRKRKANTISDTKWDEFSRSPLGLPFVILLGLSVGCITGFVGAGGGFIIVPVLMSFLRLKFKKAVGTSLTIIALNSLIGFTGNIGNQPLDWKLLMILSTIAVTGILIGSQLSSKVSSKKLKPAFGWFTLAIGCFVLTKELLLN